MANPFATDKPPPAAYASLADSLERDWQSHARPEQLPPPPPWSTWLILAGRGWGKTRTGAEWIRSKAESGAVSRIALVAATASDARDTMIEGESGLLAIAPNSNRPIYEPSKRRLTWPNGVQATAFSAEEPERLRGPQFGAAWADELAAWNNSEMCWDMLQFGMRLGKHPQQCITTTPRPSKILRALIGDSNTVVTRGSTFDNAANLAPSFVTKVVSKYQGTRLGRQELFAEILDDVVGALWTRDMLDAAREFRRVPPMQRIVVAVDPSGARSAEDSDADMIGIVVAGLGVDGRGYILADRSCKLSPAGWGRVAVDAYREFNADRIVAERNYGGAMVQHVIRSTDPNAAYKEITASRGKVQRAEPVSALYEQNRVSHLEAFDLLEDQMAAMTGNGFMGEGSPDRVDALVWALSELMLTSRLGPVAQVGTFDGPYASGGSWSIANPAQVHMSHMPASAWAARGLYHPNDKQYWIDQGVLPADPVPTSDAG
jgi:phage terminase large subunit-like protein